MQDYVRLGCVGIYSTKHTKPADPQLHVSHPRLIARLLKTLFRSAACTGQNVPGASHAKALLLHKPVLELGSDEQVLKVDPGTLL